jgi:hypothetical protein
MTAERGSSVGRAGQELKLVGASVIEQGEDGAEIVVRFELSGLDDLAPEGNCCIHVRLKRRSTHFDPAIALAWLELGRRLDRLAEIAAEQWSRLG